MSLKYDTYAEMERLAKDLGACLKTASLGSVSPRTELATLEDAAKLLGRLQSVMLDRLAEVSKHEQEQQLLRLTALEQADSNKVRRMRRLRVLDQPLPPTG